MPLASSWTQPNIQKPLISKVQNPLIDATNHIMDSYNSILDYLHLMFSAIGIVWDLYKIHKKSVTIESVNSRNSKELIRLRDNFCSHIPRQSRNYAFYWLLFSYIAHKTDWDWHMGRRLNVFRRMWIDSDWIDDGKYPETEWILTDAEKNEPTMVRITALRKALHNKEWDKAINLIE